MLGHEVAYVLARHSAERISRQFALQLGVEWLGTAAGVNPQLTQARGAILESAIQLPGAATPGFPRRSANYTPPR